MTVTTAPQSGSLRSLALNAIVLDSCEVKRGKGDPASTGEATAQIRVTIGSDEDRLTCTLNYDLTLVDEAEEVIAEVNSAFKSTYQFVEPGEMNEEALERLSRAAVVHATPYMREFGSQMTMRLGLPQFFLPLIRRKDLEIHEGWLGG